MKPAPAARRRGRHRKPVSPDPAPEPAPANAAAPPQLRRQHPRTIDTHDLAATVWQSRHRCAVGRVENLSETGLLVIGGGVEVGDITAFELRGSDFCFAGYAEVAHVTGGAMGLHVLGWRGPAGRRVQALMLRRIEGGGRCRSLSGVPAEFLG